MANPYEELDDEKKIELIERQTSEFNKRDIIRTLSNDNIKIEMAKKHLTNGSAICDVALTLEHDSSKIEIMKSLTEWWQIFYVAKTLEDPDKKIEILKNAPSHWKKKKGEINIEYLVKTLPREKMIEALKYIENYKCLVKIAKIIQDDEVIKTLMRDFFDWRSIAHLASTIHEPDYLINHMDEYLNLDAFGERKNDVKEIILRMYSKNNELLQNLNPQLLEPKYIELLGEEKINLISCYEEMQEKLVNLSEKQLELFVKCIDRYCEKNHTAEWQVLAEQLLIHISEFDELFENIAEIKTLEQSDIENLSQILSNSNWCNITNIDEVRNFRSIVQKKCEETMQSETSTIIEKREAVLQKIFGHDLKYAEKLIALFGKDNENLHDCEMKNYIRCLKAIMTTDNPTLLRKIFDSCEYVEIDETYIERSLKTEYCKEYNEGLYTPKKEDLVEGETNVYNAGTNFKMIIHMNRQMDRTARESWNRPSISSQHFCASYIRNDMLEKAQNDDEALGYGFSKMEEEALLSSSPSDIASGNTLAFRGRPLLMLEPIYTPDELINHSNGHNEIDIRRIQEGQRRQPDYLVVYKRNGKIPLMEKAKIVSENWGGLPIVIVDVDACLESERAKIDAMLLEYEQHPSKALGKQILQKVRNNQQDEQTGQNFCSDIKDRLSEIKQEVLREEREEKKEGKVTEKQLEENYEGVSAQDRSEEAGKMRRTYTKIQELLREGDEGGR